MLLLGDPNIRHHVPVMGSILVATLILAIVGLDRVAHGRWRDPWTRFVVYGLLVSLVPASLTDRRLPHPPPHRPAGLPPAARRHRRRTGSRKALPVTGSS